MQTLIIIPTYNEIDNLQKLIPQVFTVLPKTDILVVDDNSADGTGEFAQKLSRRDRRVKFIHRKEKLGLGSAYIAGFKFALKNNYDFIFEMDADLSHQPKYLPQFLAQAAKYPLVVGSRYIKGGGVTNWQTWRRLLSASANLYARMVLALACRDLTSGFKCFSRKVLETIELDSIISEGYVFQIEITYRAHKKGFAITEIPIVFKGRGKGKSKISRRICMEAVWKVPLLLF